MSNYNDSVGAKGVLGIGAACLALLVLFILLILGCVWGFKTFGRQQAIAEAKNKIRVAQMNAHNDVLLTNIKIGTTRQQVRIAQQQAQIRLQQAIGVREAQDEISKTLTPLYVQFEMVDALKQIAMSGKNSSVVYIPSGSNGIPLVQGAGPSVGK